jgi:hypothetical protein
MHVPQTKPHLGSTTKLYFIGFACNLQKLRVSTSVSCINGDGRSIVLAGYWDEPENMDRELSLFVAGTWTCLHDASSDEPYYYNQVCF